MFKYFLCLLLVYYVSAQFEKDNAIAVVVYKTLKATARSCMVKINATEADLEDLRKDPPFPHKAACIITCLLEKVGIVKDNNFSKTGFMVTVSPLVFANTKKLEHMKMITESCEKEIKVNEDTCQLGNEITSCVFKYAPELHLRS